MSELTYELRRACRTIYGVPEGNMICFIADCEVYPDHVIKVRVTPAQAEAIANRTGLIQNILPDQPKELRELFISGSSPAEYDAMLGRPKPVKKYPGYEKCLT